MTDEAKTAAVSADAQPSQIIEQRDTDVGAQGQGAKLPEGDAPKAEDKKPLSTRDAIAKAFDENEAKAKAAVDKAKEDLSKDEGKPDAKVAEGKEKAESKESDKSRAPDGKFASKTDGDQGADDKATDKSAPEKAAAGQGGEDARQSEGRKHAEPPARFLPDARTKWANVPNEVKAEVHRLSAEYEGEIEKHRQSSDRYESVRHFDETARSNGYELKDSLTKVVQIEQALARSPVLGLEMILREIGPRKADGSPLSLYDVALAVSKQTPQQFAQNMQSAQGQQQPRQGGQQQQLPPEVQQMAQELKALRTEVAVFKTQPLVEAFKAQHSDYDALEEKIAGVLSSGVVEKLYGKGLSPEQRLSQAYRMAGGSSPSHPSPEASPAHSAVETTQDRPVDPDGQKSITGAPSSGQSGEPKRKFKTNREALEAAFSATAR